VCPLLWSYARTERWAGQISHDFGTILQGLEAVLIEFESERFLTNDNIKSEYQNMSVLCDIMTLRREIMVEEARLLRGDSVLPTQETCDIKKLIHQVIGLAELEGKAEAGLTVHISPTFDRSAHVITDPRCFTGMVFRLLSNGVKQ